MSIEAEERYYLKLKAAYYFYMENLTQQEISSMLNISRPTLSKFLKEARDESIVKIEINDVKNISHLLELEVQLKKRYKLLEVKVVDCVVNNKEEIRKNLGKAAALYLECLIKSGMKIGIAWGKTLEAIVDNLKVDKNIKDLQIITLVGGSGALDYQIHANTLSQKILNNYNGSGYYLYAPLVVENEELYEALMANKEICDILEKSKKVDVALVGIGGFIDHSSILETGYFQENHIRQLKEHNAVGDICSRFFDKDGQSCNLDLNKKIIGIDLNDLKKINKVIAIAGGSEKYDSVRGALNGNLINVLITDKYTAQNIIDSQ